ncbi:sensor histidine kinase [Clostridium felsineum]|uniref:sensor histidine kinase n=1 Tax=Clostridium felsineum TaxID=36839 RepID=UPI00098BFEDF|nr:HAMP domain-containing sensor histidine kinase [Clostridium felsineum]URZ18187.1 Sensor histidine kinase RcsC [Clostridium felsineum DSM 794]
MNYSEVEDFGIKYKQEKINKVIFLTIVFGVYILTQILFFNYKFYIETSEIFKVFFDLYILFSASITYKISSKKVIIYTICIFGVLGVIDFISLISILKYNSHLMELYELLNFNNAVENLIVYTYFIGLISVLQNSKSKYRNIKIVEVVALIGLILFVLPITFIKAFWGYSIISLNNLHLFSAIVCIVITFIFIYNFQKKRKWIKSKGLISTYIVLYCFIILPNILCFNNLLGRLSFFVEFVCSILVYILVSKEVINKNIDNIKSKLDVIEKDRTSYRNALEKLSEGIIIERENKIIFMNEAQRKIFDIKKDKFIPNMDVNEIVYKASPKNEENERKIITSSGKEVYLRVEELSISVNGKEFNIHLIKDISKKKFTEKSKEEIEKMRATDKLKGEFFTNITHELRTPINVIYSAIQVMEMRIDKNNFDRRNINKYMKVLKQNCYRLLRIISNLIDITKIDSGFLKPCVSDREIISLIENITMSIVPYLHEKGMELIFDTEVEEKYVQCDPDMIERVMLNLFSNAVKFRRENGLVLVTIHDKGSKIVLEVKDNGIGIPKEKQEVIFKRFKQVNPMNVTPHQGSGIGLSLVKSIVEMNGGKISVESEENVGSTFIIEFPAVQNEVMDEYRHVKKVDDNNIKNIVEKVNIEFADIYLE